MKHISIKEKYSKEAVVAMKEKFGFKNILQVPQIEKVIVNAGIGKYINDSGIVKDIVASMEEITGQKAILTKSRKSIAGFKIRDGLEVGIKTTLRGKRMWQFIDRLVSSAIPRIKDFQGIKNSSIDANGNLNIGLKDQTIFPEVMAEDVKHTFSFQIVVVTDAKNREEGMELFRVLGFPIIK